MFQRPTHTLLSCAVGTALLTACSSSSASYGFVPTLGQDTVAVERISRTGSTFEGVLIERSPRLAVWTYSGQLDADGELQALNMSVASNPDEPPRESYSMTVSDSVVTLQMTRGEESASRDIVVSNAAFPWKTTSFAFYEMATMAAAEAGVDSLPIALVSERARGASENSVTRHGPEGMTIKYFGYPIRMEVDVHGRILAASGDETTNKVSVQRVEGLQPLELASNWAASGSGNLGQLSPRDTTRATIASAQLMVDYGRPTKRGREIFGGIIPYGEVWRTGANQATHFTTDRDLLIGGETVPAGTYTLWTIPGPDEMQLVINQQTGQWGTNYNESQDLVRIPLEHVELPSVVEQFTILIEPVGASGVLALEWDRSRFETEISVR